MNHDLFLILKQQIKERIDLSSTVSDVKLIELIEESVFSAAGEYGWTSTEMQALVKRIFDSFRGLDILQPLIDDPSVTEIMVNGHECIFFERKGAVERYPYPLESAEKLEDLIQMIVSKVNRIVNQATPIVDARLPDGSRVNIVLPPASLSGPTLTIRKFPEKPLQMVDLIGMGSISEEAAEILQVMVESGFNVFIGGGTGSGKTTFLNALSAWIPPHERVITIEDSAELQIQTVPNLVRMETRNANTEGKGEITIRDLIRSSLRMRPNRIIVGEVRGAEALDMLSAMNTGHDGSLSTGHANTSVDMLSRLETMVLSGAPLPVDVIRKQIASALDVMVHVSRIRDRTRRVTEIHEVLGVKDGEVQLHPLFLFDEKGETMDRKVIGELVYTGNRLHNIHKIRMAGKKLPAWFAHFEVESDAG
ncbi:CpaF family protein [Paenibacillus alginolyticus]|uniref:CpaF family protein n=1 Tax=Paenibacillus alginolyticus TaxID=59839 RepID=A0ABT4G9V6_9BACL|nr:CpaF family protein [Paenibacillus alginolyticus]MCY9664253.1 CpaF family protein [Paenibacillus alginolyticus]MCY9692970.1 CpaF family protein [Paenibacillus alginolyticus]MEC0148857.1 CpaF family protein [Paenibacillus alginolyticus]